MSIKTLFASFLIAGMGLVCAGQSNAELAPVVNQNFPLPSGDIGWSSSAPLCQVLPGSAASFTNYSAPSSVSFAAKSFGTIGLICNVPGIMVDPRTIGYIVFTFSNPNASSGCTASVQLVDRTTAAPIQSWTTPPLTSYTDIWTALIPFDYPLNGLDMRHTYDVEMYLYRPKSDSNCNPTAYAAYLAVIP
jgi:hypothetical protein